MFKKILFWVCTTLMVNPTFSQILYSEHFSTLTLNTGTYSANNSLKSYLYNDVPSNMFTINDGALTADTLTGNYPFYANGQKQKAWLSYKASNSTDTFAVSTSWLSPIGTANAWLVTPTIYSISVNSVLTWEAMAPDVNNIDSYQIFVTTNTGSTPVSGDFTSPIYSNNSEKGTWQKHGISLAAYAGQNIRIAFRNMSTDKYQLWLDDIVVQNINTGFDASAESHNIYKYSSINTNNNISFVAKNNGPLPISNLTINYQIGNNLPVSEIAILSPPLEYLESRQINFTIPYTSSIAAYNTFKIYTTKIDGQLDQVLSNDTITGSLTISDSIPLKKVLIEEYTGTNDGWAPDYYTTLSSIASTNTNVVVASIHHNDNMSTSEGNQLITDNASSFPSASIDHFYFSANGAMSIKKDSLNSYITKRLAMQVPATTTITGINYNPITKQIDATVSSRFVGDVKGDYRLNLYIKENNVYGPINDFTDNLWNQHSYLYNIGVSPYYQLGSYLNSNTYLLNPTDFKHQYVINSITDGAYGGAGIIPINGLTQGQTYSKTYSYVLPTAITNEFRYNTDNIYLIGVLSEYDVNTNKRNVLNVAEVKLNNNPEVLVGVKEYNENIIQLNLFPNPAPDVCNLTYTLKEDEFVKVSVYNTLGELVYIETKNVPAGNVIHTLNLNELRSGNYSVQISFKNNSITKKLTIIK